MRRYDKFCISLLLALSLLGLVGCSDSIQYAVLAGAATFATEVAAGVAGVQTDGSMALAAAAAGYQIGLKKEAERAGVDFSKIPPDWRGPNGEEIGKLSRDNQGRYCYNIQGENGENDYLVWFANEKAWSTADNPPVAVAEADIIVPRPRPAPQMNPTPVKISDGEEKPATIADARKAKKEQGLQGRMFQSSSSKTWFLEDQQGTTYKLKNGAFVRI